MDDTKKFKAELKRLLRMHGPQGWWPRLIVDGERGALSVVHHPGPKTRWLSKTRADQAFEVAIGAILTQNTAWTNVEKALVCLATKGLTTSRILSRARLPSIESCIRSSGYFRQKARKLKLFAKFVEENLGGDLHNLNTICRLERGEMKSKDLLSKASLLKILRSAQDDDPSKASLLKILRSAQDDDLVLARERLLSLWGIGPETADTILLYGLDRPVFVVDAYTRRLLFKLTGDASWSKRPYDEVRRFCESAFTDPSVGNFQEAHALIVRWGKENR